MDARPFAARRIGSNQDISLHSRDWDPGGSAGNGSFLRIGPPPAAKKEDLDSVPFFSAPRVDLQRSLSLQRPQDLDEERVSIQLGRDPGLSLGPGAVQADDHGRIPLRIPPDSHRDHPGEGHQSALVFFLHILDGRWHDLIPREKESAEKKKWNPQPSLHRLTPRAEKTCSIRLIIVLFSLPAKRSPIRRFCESRTADPLSPPWLMAPASS